MGVFGVFCLVGCCFFKSIAHFGSYFKELAKDVTLKGSLFSSPRHVSLRAKSATAAQKAVTTYIKVTEQHRLQIAVNIHA